MSMCSMEQGTKTTPAVEVWKEIEGYEGYYEVSSHGRVRSLDRYIDTVNVLGEHLQKLYKGRVLKQWYMPKGYAQISLNKDDIRNNYLVHRLVAEAFIPNPDNLPIINHKDENKANNRADNLEWCDYHYNNTYADAAKRRADYRRITVEQLTMDGQHVAYYKSTRDLERISNGRFKQSLIQRVIKGKYGHISAYGYKWRYVE